MIRPEAIMRKILMDTAGSEERGMSSIIQTICLDDPDDITLIMDEIQVMGTSC